MGLTTKRAVSTSLAVVMFTGIVGAAGYVATGFRDPQQLLSLPPLIIGSVIGAPLGVRTRDWLPENVVRIGFGVFMVIVALRLFGEASGHLLAFEHPAVNRGVGFGDGAESFGEVEFSGLFGSWCVILMPHDRAAVLRGTAIPDLRARSAGPRARRVVVRWSTWSYCSFPSRSSSASSGRSSWRRSGSLRAA